MFQITDIKGEKHNINFSNFKSGLYHIDCMEALRQMPDKCIELCICDPPYGIGVDGQKESINKNPKHNRKPHTKKGWDSAILS